MKDWEPLFQKESSKNTWDLKICSFGTRPPLNDIPDSRSWIFLITLIELHGRNQRMRFTLSTVDSIADACVLAPCDMLYTSLEGSGANLSVVLIALDNLLPAHVNSIFEFLRYIYMIILEVWPRAMYFILSDRGEIMSSIKGKSFVYRWNQLNQCNINVCWYVCSEHDDELEKNAYRGNHWNLISGCNH